MDTLVVDPFFQAMPEFFGLTLEQLLEQKHPDSWIEFEKGTLTEKQYLDSFFADARPVDAAAFRDMLYATYEWLPGMENLLARLAAAGFAIHTLSNYSIWYELIEQKLQLSRFLEWTFVSHRTGLRKPDGACYRHAWETLNVNAQQCLFVDDRELNVAAAKLTGMQAIEAKSAEQLERDLAELGVSC